LPALSIVFIITFLTPNPMSSISRLVLDLPWLRVATNRLQKEDSCNKFQTKSDDFHSSAAWESVMRIPRFPLIPILLGILPLLSPNTSSADITAPSEGGETLVLYKDYYALVIGESHPS
jgi:hypothetical protein